MAQKRMIDKKISVSEQVSNLSLKAKLIFTWSIPHADDFGLLPFSHKTLKAMIIPMEEISLEDFGFQMEDIVSANLFEVFEDKNNKNKKYYKIVKFLKNQTLKRDRKPNVLLENIDSWDDLEYIGFQMEDNGNPSKDKGSKDKGRKGKGREEKRERTPSQIFSSFLLLDNKQKKVFLEKELNRDLTPEEKKEIEKFIDYWTESNGSGTKQRWEMEKTFDPVRRIKSWFGKMNKFDNKSNDDILIIK